MSKNTQLNWPETNTRSLCRELQSGIAREYKQQRLVLLWGLIFLGYFLFVVQWYSISNFTGSINADPSLSTGWGAAFYDGSTPNALISGATNWVITLGRAFGSIMAGWLIAKVGHKYAVTTVLGLMVLSFPFLIVSQNAEWNSLSLVGGAQANQDNIAVTGFSLFVVFRIFLAIGGTTLITYTNSVIARMDASERPKYLVANQFGFNGGAFFANIFFVIPGVAAAVTGNTAVWTGILAGFICLTFILLILYVMYGIEVVPRENKKVLAQAESQVTFGKVFKQSDTWKLACIFAVWLISVVFINSSTMRTFIEQSPANFRALVVDNVMFGTADKIATSMAGSHSYFWVWPAFTCAFVAGYLIGVFWLATFGKTIFNRKSYTYTLFALGYVFMMISLLSGYFGGYDNAIALAAMLIFITLSGSCLWSIQAVLLTIPQQMEGSNPKYMGIIAGLIWGIGYFGYTIGEASLGTITSYVNPFAFSSHIKDSVNAIGAGLNLSYDTAQEEFLKLSPELIKAYEAPGTIIMIVLYWLILIIIFPLIYLLPTCGYYKANGEFVEFSEKWNPFKLSMWNITNSEFQIKNYLS